jgi:Flp pilus assembly protein protease CpaA
MIEVVLKLLLTLWLTVCSFQDLRTRTVSNWLTLPMFFLSGLYAFWRGGQNLALFGLVLVVFVVLWAVKGIGGADVKVLAALAAFWPETFFLAMALTFLWSLAQILRGKRRESYAGLPPIALAAILTFLSKGTFENGYGI